MKRTTVEQLRRFLDKYDGNAEISFIVDSAKAQVWEMWGDVSPKISLQTALPDFQDAIEWEPPDAS